MRGTELFAQRRYLVWIFLAVVLGGCGSSGSFTASSGAGGGEVTTPHSGVVQLSPRRLLPDAQVEMLDNSGNLLVQATTDQSGRFSLRPLAVPQSFTLRATLSDGTVLLSKEDESSEAPIVVDVLTTLVAEWHRRNPDISLRQAGVEILDFLVVPQIQGAEGAADDSIASEFDPDVILEQAAQNGGINAYIDALLDQLANDSSETAVFTSLVPGFSGNLDRQFLALMERNLAGPGLTNAGSESGVAPQGLVGAIGPETLVGPLGGFVFNWVAGAAGFNDTLNTVRRIESAVGTLATNLEQVQSQLKIVMDAVLAGFFDRIVSDLTASETRLDSANKSLASVLGTPDDFLKMQIRRSEPALGQTIESMGTDLGRINTTVLGSSAGSKGLLVSFIEQAKMIDLIDQNHFDALTFLVVRERNLRVRALRTLLELSHLTIGSNMINEATLAFDREMLRLKLTENEVIKRLELNGTSSQAVSGFTHAEKKWASRTLDTRTLNGLVANNGILTTPLEKRLVEQAQAGTTTLSVDSADGLEVGNLITIDTGDRQEIATVRIPVDDPQAISVLLLQEPLKYSHGPNTVVRRFFDPAINSPNLLYDNDASVIWLKTPIYYFAPARWGVVEAGFGGWLAANRQQLRHLAGHVQNRGDIRSYEGLQKLGFVGLRSFVDGVGGDPIACISTAQAGNGFVDVLYEMRTDKVVVPRSPTSVDYRNEVLLNDAPMLAVYQPEEAISSLEIALPTTPQGGEAGVAIPGSSLLLDVKAKLGQRSGTTTGPSVRAISVWTVVSGPAIFNPLDGEQPDFDRARLRISNSPGTEGRLEVRELSTDSASSPDETYVVQAQLGSNTAQATITVKPSKRFPTRPAPTYVSHVLTQSKSVIEGGSSASLRAFGRFRPTESTGSVYGTSTDVGQNITDSPSLEWRILNDSTAGGPDVTKIATIPLHPTAGTGTALLTINKNVPGHPIPAGGIFVTVLAEWKGTLATPTNTVARARFLVTP